MKKLTVIAAGGLLGLVAQTLSAAKINLFEYNFNIDGLVDPAPTGLDDASFDYSTGLGSLTIELTTPGSRYVSFFVDHEIDEWSNGWFNETGAMSGSAEAGQSWEIDEPKFYFGDIFDNFSNGTLDDSIFCGTNPTDNTSYCDSSLEDDVSMALAWDFTLATDETALISFDLSDTPAPSGFYLTQTDPDSNQGTGQSIYFSSTLDISSSSTPPNPVPAPAPLGLLAAGAFAWGLNRRRSA
ncbi:PEP-CTERM sorting domain-containing protein [Halochromatium glycolicum]|uniref:PEP-CTERM protein-sorting domain-containing protein n=1 Tax=Halochromatium glycolicum TaxID=85075 RepID=A0AAJ0U074_9GAMM|nr:PEP-CTERM sorting domain-containing protein [Halochromatium glycolicum]MBK1702976.1 hypothetical protein [Halochromatium glycolicum]